MKKHRLGVSYTDLSGLSPEEAVKLYKDIGFDAFFTGFWKELETTERIGKIAEQAGKSGLFYESLHAPFDGINAMWGQDEEAGNRMLARLCHCVKTCAAFQIPIAVVHLSSGDNAPCVNDIGHKRFDVLVDTAVKYGVTVAFENQRKLANMAFVMELYQDVENVGFCWDVGHEKCFAGGREYMPLFGKKLRYTHIHDNLQQPDGDLHMIPFDAGIDFAHTAGYLKTYGQDVTLTLEIMPWHYPNVPPADFYQKAYGAACKLRNLVEE